MDIKRTVTRIRDYCARNPDAVIVITGVGAVGGTILLGGALAKTAALAAMLATASGVILLSKLPDDMSQIPGLGWLPEAIREFRWKQALVRYQVLVDIAVSSAVVVLFGATTTGVIAGALAGIGCSVLLKVLEWTQRESVDSPRGPEEHQIGSGVVSSVGMEAEAPVWV